MILMKLNTVIIHYAIAKFITNRNKWLYYHFSNILEIFSIENNCNKEKKKELNKVCTQFVIPSVFYHALFIQFCSKNNNE